MELEITPDTLDAIKQDNTNKTEDCFRAMLTKWLREHQPTWKALAEALRSPLVGRSNLAQEILELKTGKELELTHTEEAGE